MAESKEPTLAMLVGARLKELRQEAELTQHQIAEALGVERPSVAGIERGRHRKVLMDTILQYAEVLEVPPDVVLVVVDPRWREAMGWTIEGADRWRMRRDGGVLKVTLKD
jgi:transcriptional regulator with XRE-family HTH domain